jgi:hypothetical protein
MSAALINHSPDLKRLRDEGFSIEVKSGFLLVNDVPYVTANKEIARGTLVSVLTLASSEKTSQPDNHVCYFAGEYPCKADGTPITGIKNNSNKTTLAEGVEVDHLFSARPERPYADYYEKMTTYIGIITPSAQVLDPGVTAKTFRLIQDSEESTALAYTDTNASRAGIVPLMDKVRGLRIAIVGLGGTGSYVLDLLVKCPVAEIALYDADLFLQHNAFRTPGATSPEDLRQGYSKVAYLFSKYSSMHSGIRPHPVYIDQNNVAELAGFDFVFICIDRPPVKKWLFKHLIDMGVAFIDTGIDVERVDDQLVSMVRVTAANPQHNNHLPLRVSFAENEEEQEYKENIQIAELNMLNAALAVIRWKRMIGFYADLEQEFHSLYSLNNAHLVNHDLANRVR